VDGEVGEDAEAVAGIRDDVEEREPRLVRQAPSIDREPAG
jgi:hypothetical protein